MKLVPLLTARKQVPTITQVGAGPFGSRWVADITGGTFEGPRLKGRILPGGADYGLTDADGIGHLDVRAVYETDDGARIYVQAYGVLAVNEAARAAGAQRTETAFGEDYFMEQVRLETGDARYNWLNRVVVVAEGRAVPSGVEVRYYELQNN